MDKQWLEETQTQVSRWNHQNPGLERSQNCQWQLPTSSTTFQFENRPCEPWPFAETLCVSDPISGTASLKTTKSQRDAKIILSCVFTCQRTGNRPAPDAFIKCGNPAHVAAVSTATYLSETQRSHAASNQSHQSHQIGSWLSTKHACCCSATCLSWIACSIKSCPWSQAWSIKWRNKQSSCCGKHSWTDAPSTFSYHASGRAFWWWQWFRCHCKDDQNTL